MKDILQWIPNFLKGMLEVLAEAQKMAGGKIRGHIVFWMLFVLVVLFAVSFLMWWSQSAYENFSGFLSNFNINIRQVDVEIPSSLWVNILISLLVTIISFVVLIGAATVVGAFLGMLTTVIFPAFTPYRIDKIFTELIPILQRNNSANHTNETEQMLDDANKLYAHWNKSIINRVTRRLTSKKNKEKFDRIKL